MAIAREARELRALYRREGFDLIHHVALKPVIVGSLAATGLAVPTANSIAGLGYAFTSRQWKARLLGAVTAVALRRFLNRPTSMAIVQNPDDHAVLSSIGVKAARISLIPGSGVDVDRLQPFAEPDGPVRAAFVGRMLDDKGIRTLVAAHRLLRKRGVLLPLDLAGEPDEGNPDLRAAEPNWSRGTASRASPGWAGWTISARCGGTPILPCCPRVARACPRACSRRLPAAGRSSPPTCPAAARSRRPGSMRCWYRRTTPQALADALAQLAADPALRARFGAAGRRLVEERFSDRTIGALTVALYERLAPPASCLRASGALTTLS